MSTSKMFDEIFRGKENEIRITPDNEVSAFDLIRVVGGQQQPDKTWKLIVKMYEKEVEQLNITYHKFPGQGQRVTPIIDNKKAQGLIKLFLPGSRIPLSKKRKILHYFDMTENNNLRVYIEEEVHEKILKALKMFNGIQQYSILNYRIDLYFPKQKVAVECDENDHASYLNDELRTEHITNKLGNEWVRYNPYDKDFDIYNLINQILEKLVK